MPLDRRSFLSSAAVTGAALALGAVPSVALAATPSAPTPDASRRRARLAIATYSYWHFRAPKTSVETVMDKSAALGVEGVDILHRQMEIAEKAPLDAAGRAYLHGLKRRAFVNGLSICCVSTHQSFVQRSRRS